MLSLQLDRFHHAPLCKLLVPERIGSNKGWLNTGFTTLALIKFLIFETVLLHIVAARPPSFAFLKLAVSFLAHDMILLGEACESFVSKQRVFVW